MTTNTKTPQTGGKPLQPETKPVAPTKPSETMSTEATPVTAAPVTATPVKAEPVKAGTAAATKGETKSGSKPQAEINNGTTPVSKPPAPVAKAASAESTPTAKPVPDAAPKAAPPAPSAPDTTTLKAEAPKVDAPKVDAPKVDAPKAKATRAKASKAPASKAPASKAPASKAPGPGLASAETSPASVAALPVETVKTVEPVKAAAKPAPGKPVATQSAAKVAGTASTAQLGFDLLPGGDAVAMPLRMALDLSTQGARDGYVRARESQAVLQKACAESVDAASRGLVTMNAQWIDLVRMHSDATLGLWRATITAPSLSEAVKAQTSGIRKACDSTAAQLKAIAETGNRVASETTEPLRRAFPGL